MLETIGADGERMRRLLLIPTALLGLATAGAMASVQHASLEEANSSVTGTILSLRSNAITVGAGQHHRLRCTLSPDSPSTQDFASGDRVKIACASHVLVAIADAPAHHRNTSNADVTTTGISGAITALDTDSITIHDGDRTVTCTIGSGSPSTNGYPLGAHARIGCADAVLVSIGPPGPAAPTAATVTNANGPIAQLGPSSISVQTMSCTIGAGSPSIDGFHVGDSVRMYCVNGVLYQLKHDDTPPPAPPTTTTAATTTAQGTITGISGTIGALGASSITVTGGDGGTAVLTCTIGQGSASPGATSPGATSPGTTSPSTAGFAPGNLVRMYCQNGLLFQLKHTDSTTTTTTAPAATATTTTTTTPGAYTAINGTIGPLTGSSITVTGGDSGTASLTCSLGSGTPSTSGFAAGDSVRMYCLNGALFQLKHNDAPATTTTTTTTTAATTTTAGTTTNMKGTIGALGTASITVGNGGESLTCSIGAGSPSIAGFSVGNAVSMYCLNGALYALSHS